jgi:hypothetical protein
MKLKWTRSYSTGHLFLKRGNRALGAIFTRKDGRGYSWWAARLGEDTVAYTTEEETIEALYQALGM